MSKERRVPVYDGDGNVVGFETKRGRGRPKTEKNFFERWLGGSREEDSKPLQVILKPEASEQMHIVAGMTNFLNGYPMDKHVIGKLERMQVDWEKVQKNRSLYAAVIQGIREQVYEEYCDVFMEMGNYIMGDNTAGMGTVAAAMTGERDKRGKFRR